jgi:hypothetical protein
MIDRSVQEWIQNEIDGENPPEVSAKVRRMIAADPEAMRLFEELRALSFALAGIESAEPPSTLRPSVVHTIEKRLRQPRGSGWLVRRTLEKILPAPGFRYSLVFAAGILAGVMVYAAASRLLFTLHVAEGDAVGTMGTAHSRPVSGTVLNTPIAGDHLQGSAAMEFGEDHDVLRLSLRSESDIVVVVHVESQFQTITAVRQQSGTANSFTVTTDSTAIRVHGDIVCDLYLKPVKSTHSPVTLSVWSDGRTLFEGTVNHVMR